MPITKRYSIASTRFLFSVPILLLAMACQAAAQTPEDVAALRKQLEAQEALLREQQELMQKQQEALARLTEQIESMKKRIDELEKGIIAPSPAPAQAATPPQITGEKDRRDSVGDLNAGSVKAGTFPGSFEIPGSRNVSLAIGGFVKTVAIADSKAENQGSNFLPSTMRTQFADTTGKFAIDSTLTRLFIDARAPARSGSLRGYIEYDLNGANNNSLSFKLRHAYGNWQNRSGTLTAGHTWSTLMDLGILPEGLTEPTVSGAIFMRQAQLRWTQNLGENLKADFSVENPSGADLFINEFDGQTFQSHTRFPDFIAGINYAKSGSGHVRLTGIVRRLQLASVNENLHISATGWGLSLGSHLNTVGKDRLAFSASYGKGLGRYLLGLGSMAGGMLDPNDGKLKLRDNYGGIAWYQHFWSSSLRSTGAVGYARSDPFAIQPGDEFKSTAYAFGNLMWTILPYLNVGFEYDYGQKNVKDGSQKDNHRVMLGMQIF